MNHIREKQAEKEWEMVSKKKKTDRQKQQVRYSLSWSHVALTVVGSS